MKAYIALGSNLGDRREYLIRALDMIDDRIEASSVYETDPVGGPPGQEPYLNMVVALETTRSPRELLEMCRRIEEAAGRERAERWGPRTLDADLLLVGDLTVDEPDLVVPHRRMWERPFVLVPLAEVAPEFGDRLAGLDTSTVRNVGGLFGDFDTTRGPRDAAVWFADWPGPWCVSGGWAIELFVGRTVREHHDLDVSIARADAARLHDALPGWQLVFNQAGDFAPWERGAALSSTADQLWCRPAVDAPWALEVMLEDLDAATGVWRFRKDASVSLPLPRAIRRTPEGIPYVAPEIQLLYKAKACRPRDELDLAAALPLLSGSARAWLASLLTDRHPGHPWLTQL